MAKKAQDVAFAAAAGGRVYWRRLGGRGAAGTMAMTEGHSYQVEAIKTMRFLSDRPADQFR